MPIVGIDLGTTNSCVAVCRDGRIEVLENCLGKRTTPTFMAISPEGEWIFGEEAKDQATLNPSNTLFNMKRLIGREVTEKCIQNDKKYWPFKVVDDNGQLAVKLVVATHTRLYTIQEITAMFLKHMKKEAETQLGESVEEAVITVPAYFNDQQRSATIEAGRIAGLKVKQIINEPTAAGLAYEPESRSAERRMFLVYDLGGGTFDVSIIQSEGNSYEVKATAGDAHLGGEDFDEQLVKFCLEGVKSTLGTNVGEDPSSMQRLRTACEQAKRTLSTQWKASVELEGPDEEHGYFRQITRTEFEELNAPLFERTMDVVRKTLEDASLRPDQIDDVLLIGGSTRIPKIQEMLRRFFRREILNKGVNPDEAVAYGAAKYAAGLAPHGPASPPLIFLKDVLSFSLGLEISGGKMDVVIQKNTTVPVTKTRLYRTTNNDQTNVLITMYEGENELARDNRKLGEFRLIGITPRPKGQVRIEVEFNVDENGVLHVGAREQEGKVQKEITVNTCLNRLTDEEIERLQKGL
ncbi:unnamed protein product [Calicophoron daubneyi]|uniref:Heat shock protein 70 n=1 Tax=Calicophoron daubneyi TaxID=300641 RepID=A0AAV2TV52_CALDB